jgi:hypothetical protein
MEFADQAVIGSGFFDGVKILALQVLHQSDLERLLFRYVPQDGWYAVKTGTLRRPPTAFTGNKLEARSVLS